MTWPRRAILHSLATEVFMALLQSFLGVMSGKVGGYVFQHNGRVRMFFMPTPSYTSLQLAARAALVAAATRWAVITEALQDAWLAWSETRPKVNRVGQKYVMSSRAAFVSLNAARVKAGIAQIDAPPAIGLLIESGPVIPSVTGVIDSGDPANLALTMISPMTIASGEVMAVYIGAPRSSTSRKARLNLVLAGTIPGAATPVAAGSIPLPTGSATVGDVFDVKVVIHDDTTLVTRVETLIVQVT